MKPSLWAESSDDLFDRHSQPRPRHFSQNTHQTVQSYCG
ncbi:hypothetical protein CKA32_002846 [Geitlerinema sp. FC II]|nr:hypothetical protein CKA32_002846 [Geitlerinema sp. FC II]